MEFTSGQVVTIVLAVIGVISTIFIAVPTFVRLRGSYSSTQAVTNSTEASTVQQLINTTLKLFDEITAMHTEISRLNAEISKLNEKIDKLEKLIVDLREELRIKDEVISKDQL